MDARRGRKYPGGHPRARHAVVPHRPEAGAPHARRRAKPVAPPPAVGGGVSRRNHGARQRGAASRRARPSHNASAAAAAGACSRRRPDRHRGGVAQSDGGHTCPCRGAVDAHHRRGAWPLPLDDAGGRDHRGGSQAARPEVAQDCGDAAEPVRLVDSQSLDAAAGGASPRGRRERRHSARRRDAGAGSQGGLVHLHHRAPSPNRAAGCARRRQRQGGRPGGARRQHGAHRRRASRPAAGPPSTRLALGVAACSLAAGRPVAPLVSARQRPVPRVACCRWARLRLRASAAKSR
mmetsp:Transcript_37831/g.118705  ORF Transcript_37831/g.118705 Transcript_37831/m.118705 type:complete len:292 (-) Transcript_37831:387-1262(-)